MGKIRTKFGKQDECSSRGEYAYKEQKYRHAKCDEAEGDEGEAKLTGAHCFDTTREDSGDELEVVNSRDELDKLGVVVNAGE